MNGRERILAAINHREPDRVPIDIGATNSSSFSALAYSNLIRHLNYPVRKNRVYDVVQQVTQPDDIILDMFQIDVVNLGRSFNTKEESWYDMTLSNEETAQYPIWFHPVLQQSGDYYVYNAQNELIAVMPEGATFFDQSIFPYVDGYPVDFKQLTNAISKVHWGALPISPFDHINEADFWKQLREKAIDMRNNSDRAIMVVAGCSLFEWGTYLRRIDNFLMDLLLEPQKVEELLDRLMELHMDTLEKICGSVGDVVDIVRFSDDLGTNNGPFMSPKIFRQVFKPRQKIMCDYVKKNSQMKTFLHSCGSIYKLIPDLIEAGIDIINPVQISCKDMEPAKLKSEFGKDIVFWGGGCDTKEILNRATPQQVKDHVKRNIDILAPGGGFVFSAVHNIMPDVPPENIVAMIEAVHES